jgi:hypothetical protein
MGWQNPQVAHNHGCSARRERSQSASTLSVERVEATLPPTIKGKHLLARLGRIP